jgi:hypothetical protein
MIHAFRRNQQRDHAAERVAKEMGWFRNALSEERDSVVHLVLKPVSSRDAPGSAMSAEVWRVEVEAGDEVGDDVLIALAPSRPPVERQERRTRWWPFNVVDGHDTGIK